MHQATERKTPEGTKARKVRVRASAMPPLECHAEKGMERPAGQCLFYWLGKAAREMRTQAGVKPEAIAVKLGESKEKVSRFETGKTRPQDIEQVLAIYGGLLGLGDPREIVERAMQLWLKCGEAPTLLPPAEAEAGEESARRPGPEPPTTPPDRSEPQTDEEDQRHSA